MYINKYVFIHLNIYIYTGDDGQLICCDACPRTFCFDCARLVKEPRGKRLYLYLFVCMYVCLYGYESIAICLYIHILMSAREGTVLYMYERLSVYIYVYVYMCVCIFACMFCMYVYTCT